jgi:poly(beta-D-mannuronate) lyase
MSSKLPRILFAILLFAILPAAIFAATLRSPWDAKPVTVKDGAYACPNHAPLPKDIHAFDFYSDDKHSIIDPKRYAQYQDAERQFHEATRDAIDAAENFRATGSRGAADCVLKLLDRQADADAMTGEMASNQSFYVQNWTIGSLAIAWLKVRDANPGTPEDRAKATAWLAKVANATKVYFTARHERGTNDGTNNHFYWAGFAVMAAGIADNDRSFFDWGIATCHEAFARIQPDGSLPLEMLRGQRALHYHIFALSPLVIMAEMAYANGIDLYTADGNALQRLAKLVGNGLVQNTYFTAKAGVAQDTPEKSGLKSEDVLWIIPYTARFPDPGLSRILHSVSLRPYDYLGGYPPGYPAD